MIKDRKGFIKDLKSVFEKHQVFLMVSEEYDGAEEYIGLSMEIMSHSYTGDELDVYIDDFEELARLMNNYPDDVRFHDSQPGSPWNDDEEKFEALLNECIETLLNDHVRLEESLFSDEAFTRKMLKSYLTATNDFVSIINDKVNEIAEESARQQMMKRGK